MKARLLFAMGFVTIPFILLLLSGGKTARADGEWPASSDVLELDDSYSATVVVNGTTDVTTTLASLVLTADNVLGGEIKTEDDLVTTTHRCTGIMTDRNILGNVLFEHRASLEFYFTGVHTYPWNHSESHQTYLGWSLNHLTDNITVSYDVDYITTDYFEGPLWQTKWTEISINARPNGSCSVSFDQGDW